ncbi:TetR/AcrR family transcriptional regulator [Gemmatimonadota bacterium]
MPLPRFEKIPAEKKELIFEAAAKEFAENGYEGAVMSRILERADISKGAAYYYFEDKADLIATVVRRYWTDFLDEPTAQIEDFTAGDFWKKLHALYLHPFDLIESQPWMLGFSKAVWHLPEEVRTSGPMGEVFDDAIGWVKGFVRRGLELGVIRDDLPEGMLIRLIMALDHVHDEWLSDHWAEMGKKDFETFTGTYVDLMQKALECPRSDKEQIESGGMTS